MCTSWKYIGGAIGQKIVDSENVEKFMRTKKFELNPNRQAMATCIRCKFFM